MDSVSVSWFTCGSNTHIPAWKVMDFWHNSLNPLFLFDFGGLGPLWTAFFYIMFFSHSCFWVLLFPFSFYVKVRLTASLFLVIFFSDPIVVFISNFLNFFTVSQLLSPILSFSNHPPHLLLNLLFNSEFFQQPDRRFLISLFSAPDSWVMYFLFFL